MNTRLILASAACLLLASCASTYEQRDMRPIADTLDPGKTVLISVPADGTYGATVYENSGRMTAEAVLVAFALGGLYYCTAPRRYQARSELLVTHTGGELWSTATTTHASRDMVPTYQRLFRSAKVVDGAIARLRKRDPQARVDFAGVETLLDQLPKACQRTAGACGPREQDADRGAECAAWTALVVDRGPVLAVGAARQK